MQMEYTDEVGGYPAVAESAGGVVVEEVVAVRREVGLDDGVDVVVVPGVHDGVAEHDEGGGHWRRLVGLGLPLVLLLLGHGRG